MLFCLLTGFCLAPVWSFDYFVNQDGSAHVYSSFAIKGIASGDPQFRSFFSMNSVAVPNSSGHWLMALLAFVFSPWVVTKLIVSVTFAGIVAGAGWLRYRTNGIDGVATSFLFGAAVAFNWLWLVGFYNFLIGAGCFLLTVGLFAGWRDRITMPRAVALAFLCLLAYFSHIVSFMVLAGTLTLLTFAGSKDAIRRNLTCVILAIVPALPFVVIFRGVSGESAGGFSPAWRNLSSVWSPASWFNQIRTADPFILISRKALPFVDEPSVIYAALSPVIWIGAAIILLLAATSIRDVKTNQTSPERVIFLLLFAGGLFTALFSPDDFGLTNGSVLRERVLLCTVMFVIPLFRADGARLFKAVAAACLSVVIIFQTIVLWDYARETNRDAAEFMTLAELIIPTDRVATVTIQDTPRRFSSSPGPMMSNYFGADGTGRILDNYELGHYLFPVAAKSTDEKDFILELTQNSVLRPAEATAFSVKKSKLGEVLAKKKIDKLILVGSHPDIEDLINRHFTEIHRAGQLRVYRAVN